MCSYATKLSISSQCFTICMHWIEHHGPITLDVGWSPAFYAEFVAVRWRILLSVFISLSSFFAISITCLAITQPKRSSGYVWTTFVNDTGWRPNGLVFLLGLINPLYGFCGLDGAIHLAEDCFEPAKTVPRALCTSLVVGFVTAFLFVVSMLYCIKDIEAALNSRTGYGFGHSPKNAKLMCLSGCQSMRLGSRQQSLGLQQQHWWPRWQSQPSSLQLGACKPAHVWHGLLHETTRWFYHNTLRGRTMDLVYQSGHYCSTVSGCSSWGASFWCQLLVRCKRSQSN